MACFGAVMPVWGYIGDFYTIEDNITSGPSGLRTRGSFLNIFYSKLIIDKIFKWKKKSLLS